MDGSGKRFNQHKTRYDLIPTRSLKDVSDVFEIGVKKYGERNWQKGMRWSNILSSLERHLQSIKNNEDYDKESGLLHVSHIISNSMMLNEYYHIYPQGDDRDMNPYNDFKIGLDIDGVIADFNTAYEKYNNLELNSLKHWNFNWDSDNQLKDYPEEFWMDIKPLTNSQDLPFEPSCYITSRHCKKEITLKWLEKNGFPYAPVYHVEPGNSKLDCALESGIDMFVDDNFHNFIELNKGGVFCWLFDCPHNKKYNVGFKRIKSLNELK